MKRVGPWVLALLLCGVASAQTVEFISPPSDIVRGSVPISVDLGPGQSGGYVMFYVGAADQPLTFRMSTLADENGLFTYNWETQSQSTPVPDGAYRVLAVAYNSADQAVGQASRTFEVQNTVPPSQLPVDGILLRFNLTPSAKPVEYQANSTAQDVTSADEGADLALFRTSSSARWRQLIMRREPGGTAQVRHTISAFSETSEPGSQVSKALALRNRFLTFGLTPLGDVVPRKEYTDIDFTYGELSLQFPADRVKIGDSWRSPMRILYEPGRSRTATVVAKHTFKGVEWFGGQRCAIIESTFEGGPYRVSFEDLESTPPAAAAGGAPGSGPMMGGAPGGGPMMGGMPGMGSEGMGGMAGMGATQTSMLHREATIIVKNGKRTTYFAYQPEVGQVLRVQETQDQQISLALQKEPPQQMGMGGMGGYGGAYPGMGGSGMYPGMGGYGSTYPGMGGSGMYPGMEGPNMAPGAYPGMGSSGPGGVGPLGPGGMPTGYQGAPGAYPGMGSSGPGGVGPLGPGGMPTGYQGAPGAYPGMQGSSPGGVGPLGPGGMPGYMGSGGSGMPPGYMGSGGMPGGMPGYMGSGGMPGGMPGGYMGSGGSGMPPGYMGSGGMPGGYMGSGGSGMMGGPMMGGGMEGGYMGSGGLPGGMPGGYGAGATQEPPKYNITYVTRKVQTEITQARLVTSG